MSATTKSSNRRKFAAVALAVLGVSGLSLASAATLNLSGSTLAANTATVASCQPTATPITASFTTSFTATPAPSYKVASVALKSVDAGCAAKAVRVTLLGASDAILGEVTGAATTGTTTFASIPAGISASDVVKLAVVISD
ncbi:hypothetical protein AB6N24_17800 [Cellulomonas sp. 179-A 4D5 NHS]|uniref:hypothetical protein n=1 Tax=Cellulomonas sp. 179-A 4D5 NHS TaxID=3142378 RepID=UPI0039A06216